jgi:hypothetical protein
VGSLEATVMEGLFVAAFGGVGGFLVFLLVVFVTRDQAKYDRGDK